MEKNEMGRSCSAYRGEERGCIGSWWGNLGVRGHLREPGDPCVDARIITSIFRKRDVVEWIGSSWLRIGTGSALVNVLMNRRFP